MYIINDFEENIYTNYLDSGFDSVFGNYDYRDLATGPRLEDLMNDLLEEVGEPKIGEDDDEDEEDEDE